MSVVLVVSMYSSFFVRIELYILCFNKNTKLLKLKMNNRRKIKIHLKNILYSYHHLGTDEKEQEKKIRGNSITPMEYFEHILEATVQCTSSPGYLSQNQGGRTEVAITSEHMYFFYKYALKTKLSTFFLVHFMKLEGSINKKKCFRNIFI
jgi:hypothetical protein